MFLAWLFIAFIIGLMAGSIIIKASPELLVHMREIIELHEDYEKANRELKQAKADLQKDVGLVCPKYFEDMTIPEIKGLLKRIEAKLKQ